MGIITFEIEGKSYTVYFGMKAAEIFGKLLIDIESKEGSISSWDWFVGLLYAGLCNEAYNNRVAPILFKEASILADSISSEIQSEIYACYEGSKAGKEIQAKIDEMMKLVNPEKKSEAEIVSQKLKIGKKLKSSPTES